MTLVAAVLSITAPVFLLAAVGFAWVRLGFEYRLQFVTRLAMNLAVPCLIFTALMKTQLARDVLAEAALATLLAYALVALAVLGFCRVAGLEARIYAAPLTFANTGNIGLPLALFAFGPPGLDIAVVIFAIMAVGSFTFGVWLVSGAGSVRPLVREPIVWASLLGGLFLGLDWQTPDFLTRALDLVGQMAIPLMLITLGVSVARLRPGPVLRAGGLALAKVALSVAAAVAVGSALGLSDLAFSVLVLQMATPIAVTSYLLAERYQAGPEEVAGLVVTSTALSVLVLPLVLAALL